MKKAFIIILSLIITSCFAACGQASSSKPTAKAKRLFSETTSEQKDLATDYTLDKEISFGEIRFCIDEHWNETSITDSLIYQINDTVSLYVNKTSYNSRLLSEDDLFEIHSEPDSSHEVGGILNEEVSGNNVLLFTHTPISKDNPSEKYSRHIIVAINDYCYDLYTKGNADDWSPCNSIINDIFDSLVLPNKEKEQITTETATEKETETHIEDSTKDRTEQLLFDDNGIKITYTGLSSGFERTNLNVRIENNSGKDFLIQTREESVNGYMVDPVFSCFVKDGKIANDEITFRDKDLSKNGITTINSVEFYFIVAYNNSFRDSFNTPIISFNP